MSGTTPRTMRTPVLLIRESISSLRPRSHAATWRSHLLALAVLLGSLSSQSARAQIDPRKEGLASNGLCGLGLTAYPTCPKRLGLSAAGGYGYTESMGPVHGGHQRVAGALGAGITPLSWLSVALRLDGRLDFHPSDDRGSDKTGTGDPRLFLRAGRVLGRDFSLGGEAVAWFPGNKAPSFKPSATSVDLKALAAWTPHALPLSLLGYVGYRFDQSANSAPDLRRLRAGDRVAISLSDADAVLLALGATTRAVKRAELFCELSLDALVGSKAPAFSKSPLRGTLGARGFLNPKLQGEVSATAAFNGRPSFATGAPLVPVEPRFLLNFGVRYGYDLAPPKKPSAAEHERPAVQEPAAIVQATVSGTLVDGDGAPLPDVRVSLTTAPPAVARETITDGEGKYAFERVPVGSAALEAAAPGFDTAQWTVEVQPQMAPAAKRQLTRKGNLGTLRLLTRSFGSDPLAAAILIRDARGKKMTSGKANEQGLFEFDLPPGRYVVMISAPGYRAHRREVQIERYGVAILNVDMREEK